MTSKILNDVKKGAGAGVDALLTGVNFVAEKTGYGIKVARLYRKKAKLQSNIKSEFNALGIAVHKKITSEKLDDVSQKLEVQDMLKEITQKQSDLFEISKKIDNDLKDMKKKTKSFTKVKPKNPIKHDSVEDVEVIEGGQIDKKEQENQGDEGQGKEYQENEGELKQDSEVTNS